MSGPLDGVKVLDFSKVLAGPLCTQYLADMGADVVKVEPVDTGDETRGWPPFREGFGAVFLSANRGKRSLALDLKTEPGRALAQRLAALADVVVESFGTGVVERLGIDEATLRAANPDLVYCSISGFGRSGPMKEAPGYDVILQAFSGIMSLTGEEGGPPVRSPISPIDQSTGFHALSGILAALYGRAHGGGGRRVEVSLFETAVGLLGYNLQSFWQRGSQPERCGSSHESLCPYQAFEAADGPVMIGVANDGLWRRFCAVAGLEDVVEDPRFRTNAARVEHRAETIACVQAAVARQPVAFWDAELAKVKVPCAPINSLRQMLDHPHTAASGIVLDYDHPIAGPLKSVAQPVRFSGVERGVTRPAPALGQHSDEVLRDLGLSTEEIDALSAQGVIR
ncbi:CaiB/BaiF CoA transferase family protein [Tistlia consotensis]|uniref:CaiB/BaiF CoA transferase family protein n=1 Tax=Tistlia consotensis TaxID=1321365 RepID=UPI00190EE33E|nr:CaiB/BaiF CoA-transferase family protein [Tistlia consotensis]